jgi:hypothetical protein
LNEKSTIQKFLAGWLLVLFTISFVPKSLFHDAFADHKDIITCEHPGKNATCVHEQGFRCDFNDLVVGTPYVSNISNIGFLLPVFSTTFTSNYSPLVLQQLNLGTDSRGPPSIIVA